MADAWQDIAASVKTACVAWGFDLVQPFCIGWYNAGADPAYALPDLGRASALGLLVGHTRAIWDPFRAAVRDDRSLRDSPNPLERYTEERVSRALRPLAHRWETRWSHEAPPRRVAMQRLGHVSGLAHLSPCFLNVHPVYGPWIALRAAAVIDVDGPAGPSPDPPNPCPDCAHTCVPLFERAAAAFRERPDLIGLGDTWRLWLAVRDACPVGREYRYSDDQIAYHYRGDRGVLI